MKNSLRKAIVLLLSFIPLSLKADYYELTQEDNYGYEEDTETYDVSKLPTSTDIVIDIVSIFAVIVVILSVSFAIDFIKNKEKIGWVILSLLFTAITTLCCIFSPWEILYRAFIGYISLMFLYMIGKFFHGLYKEIKKDL